MEKDIYTTMRVSRRTKKALRWHRVKKESDDEILSRLLGVDDMMRDDPPSNNNETTPGYTNGPSPPGEFEWGKLSPGEGSYDQKQNEEGDTNDESGDKQPDIN